MKKKNQNKIVEKTAKEMLKEAHVSLLDDILLFEKETKFNSSEQIDFQIEELPGIIYKNEAGEEELYRIIGEKYIPDVEASIYFTKRDILRSLAKLEKLKKQKVKREKDIQRIISQKKEKDKN